MIISLNWLKKFTDIDMPIDKLAVLIGARLVEIEQIVNLGEKYKDALIVNVVEANKLEGSDHLSLTKIDDGGITKDIERDELGNIQVICGASNVRSEQRVIWLPPNSIVPMTYQSNEPFILGSRKLMGETSNGMIASAKELDFYDEHEGILEIIDNIKPGTPLTRAYELDDILLDIENKSLTHRPDCFSTIGFAREATAISGKSFRTPEWLVNTTPDFAALQSDEVKLEVTIDNPELSSRYTAIVMSGADGDKQSPLQIQTYLSRVGVRPINAVVDVTNYLMMLTGQPLHAFDYDKVVAVGGGKADIHVRAGCEGEKLELLDGKVINLSSEDIVIAAGQTPIALAGAMGGLNTEIDDNTRNIIIESATFNLYNLRATQMRYGIFSEAITRFTKGQPASLTAPVLFEAVRLMGEWAGAKCISKIEDAYPIKQQESKVDFSINTINAILGSDFTADKVINTLQNIEFKIDSHDSMNISAIAPYWRSDIHIVEDIAEEVSRINGFENIKPTLPMRDFKAVKPSDFDEFKIIIRNTLVRAGSNEVLTYSFVHDNIIEKAQQNPKNSYKIVNSISPDLRYYRQSLTPSLLDLVHPNIKQGYGDFALFEINKTHSKQDGLNDEKVPNESDMIALVTANKNKSPNARFYKAKHVLDFLAEKIGVNIYYIPFSDDLDDQISMPFEHKRSAMAVDGSGNKLGIVGEYKKIVQKGYKLPNQTAGFELHLDRLFSLYTKSESKFKPLSRYPSSERDVCFKIDKNLNFTEIVDNLKHNSGLDNLDTEISPVDIYQSENSETKNVTVRIKLTSFDHTLTGDEVNHAVSLLSNSVVEKTGATVI